jgi:hypothetical protein
MENYPRYRYYRSSTTNLVNIGCGDFQKHRMAWALTNILTIVHAVIFLLKSTLRLSHEAARGAAVAKFFSESIISIARSFKGHWYDIELNIVMSTLNQSVSIRHASRKLSL